LKTRLSVNINKFATIRNARGGNNPDLIKVAADCEAFGAEGITVHPRPDERHIRYEDVRKLKDIVNTEFNIEGYPSEDFIQLVIESSAAQVTLVPDPPEALTSNTGWDTIENLEFLQSVIARFKNAGIRTSIFLNPDPTLIPSAAKTGADRIELYTGTYAEGYKSNREEAIKPFAETAELAIEHGLEINAGHDLDLNNLKYFVENVPNVMEVSIGHALICDALYLGLEGTIDLYKQQLIV
jgi:pyridoxine 5-phosphate synthase